MDWRRTKTIFIVTFLIIDLFLGYQLLEKKNENRMEMIKTAPIEEQLEYAAITYPKLPDSPDKMAHISGEMHVFTKEELTQLHEDKVTITYASENRQIIGHIDDPFLMPPTDEKVDTFFHEHLLYSDEYVLRNLPEGSIYLTQVYNDRPLFHSNTDIGGQVNVTLDDELNVERYKQSYLDMRSQGNEKEILSALEAVYKLYEKDELQYKDEITDIELGYYSLFQGDVQVFAPTWYVEVNKTRYYFVNAITSKIYQ